MERVGGVTAVRFGVREARDDIEELRDRAGQPCVMRSGIASACGERACTKWTD